MLQFAVGVILARLLAPEDFGLLVSVQVFMGIAGLLADGGMGQALVRIKDLPEDYVSTYFTAQILICSGIYAVFFFAAPWIATGYSNPIYQDLVRVSALSFPLRAIQNPPRSLLYREMRSKVTGVIEWCELFSSGVISILMAQFRWGGWSLVFSGLLSSVLLIIPLFYCSGWRPRIAFNHAAARELSRYGAQSTINDLVEFVRVQVPNFLIGQLLGPGLLGAFNKADTLRTIPIDIISGAVYQPLFRGLALTQDNIDRSKYLYLRSVGLTMVYCLPAYVGLWWVAGPFIEVIYGSKWSFTAAPLHVLATAGFFNVMVNQSGAVIAARSLFAWEISIQCESAVLAFVAILAAVPYGLAGIAWSLVGVFTFMALRMTYLASRSVDAMFSELLTALRPAAILNALLFVALLAVNSVWLYLYNNSSGLYLLVISTSGFFIYVGLFLTLPLGNFMTEKMRWRRGLAFFANPDVKS